MPFKYVPSELTMPATQELADGDTWALLKPFQYTTLEGEKILVPPSAMGCEEDILSQPLWTTDYGSIPMAFQNIYRKDGEYAPAYVLHDWLYSAEIFERSKCDWILLEALQELGAWWFTRNTVYSAVRCGGGMVWANHDPVKVAALKDYLNTYRQAIADLDNPNCVLAGMEGQS